MAKWSTIRGFGNIKYFNISYGILLSVPVLYELYAKSVPFMKWFGAPEPFPTTLRWLYAASFCYAIAIAIYQFFCPAEIKRFGKEDDEYLRTQYDSYLRALPHHRLSVVLANFDTVLDRETYDQIHELLRMGQADIETERVTAQKRLDELVLELHPDAVQRYLLRAYEKQDSSKAVARWSSFALYVLGSIIVLILLIWRSYGVLLG